MSEGRNSFEKLKEKGSKLKGNIGTVIQKANAKFWKGKLKIIKKKASDSTKNNTEKAKDGESKIAGLDLDDGTKKTGKRKQGLIEKVLTMIQKRTQKQWKA